MLMVPWFTTVGAGTVGPRSPDPEIARALPGPEVVHFPSAKWTTSGPQCPEIVRKSSAYWVTDLRTTGRPFAKKRAIAMRAPVTVVVMQNAQTDTVFCDHVFPHEIPWLVRD